MAEADRPNHEPAEPQGGPADEPMQSNADRLREALRKLSQSAVEEGFTERLHEAGPAEADELAIAADGDTPDVMTGQVDGADQAAPEGLAVELPLDIEADAGDEETVQGVLDELAGLDEAVREIADAPVTDDEIEAIAAAVEGVEAETQPEVDEFMPEPATEACAVDNTTSPEPADADIDQDLADLTARLDDLLGPLADEQSQWPDMDDTEGKAEAAGNETHDAAAAVVESVDAPDAVTVEPASDAVVDADQIDALFDQTDWPDTTEAAVPSGLGSEPDSEVDDDLANLAAQLDQLAAEDPGPPQAPAAEDDQVAMLASQLDQLMPETTATPADPVAAADESAASDSGEAAINAMDSKSGPDLDLANLQSQLDDLFAGPVEPVAEPAEPASGVMATQEPVEEPQAPVGAVPGVLPEAATEPVIPANEAPVVQNTAAVAKESPASDAPALESVICDDSSEADVVTPADAAGPRDMALKELDQALADDVDDLLHNGLDSIDEVLDGVFDERALVVHEDEETVDEEADLCRDGDDAMMSEVDETAEPSAEPGEPAISEAAPAGEPLGATEPAASADDMPLPEGIFESVDLDEMSDEEFEASAAACETQAADPMPDASDELIDASIFDEPPAGPGMATQLIAVARGCGSVVEVPLVTVLSGLNFPLRMMPVSIRPIVDWVALSLVFWVPIVWVIALLAVGS